MLKIHPRLHAFLHDGAILEHHFQPRLVHLRVNQVQRKLALIDVLELLSRLPFLGHHEDMLQRLDGVCLQLPQRYDRRAELDTGKSEMVRASGHVLNVGSRGGGSACRVLTLDQRFHRLGAILIHRHHDKRFFASYFPHDCVEALVWLDAILLHWRWLWLFVPQRGFNHPSHAFKPGMIVGVLMPFRSGFTCWRIPNF